MAVLITGGAGYIGSHTCIEFLSEGEEVVVIDNLCNSSKEAIDRVECITGKKIKFYKEDILNNEILDYIFKKEKINCVIHFAGLKAVSESVHNPLDYYRNNITGTLTLLNVMKNNSVKKIIFSSSATVYGKPQMLPIGEDAELSVTNPYGRTKLILEEILTDLHIADPEWSIVILRYFNPIGAHKSGMIGEDPKGVPNNLIPYVTQVAVGKLKYVNIYGNDYNTKDGTGVRDYIHVVDLAKGHVKAVKELENTGVHIYNLGTGNGYSVFDIIHCFEKVSQKSIPYRIRERRAGDIASCYANVEKAWKEIKWKAAYNLKDMCEDSWRWQEKNPNGY